MNIKQARELLGIETPTTFEDIRLKFRILAKQYHPDNLKTGNESKFILISSAYLLLQSKELGLKSDERLIEDIDSVTSFRSLIENYLDIIWDNYKEFSSELKSQTKKYVQNSIDSSRNTSQLKNVVNDKLAYHLVDVKSKLEFYLKDMHKSVKKESQDVIFRLFRKMYQERRKYWLLNIWKEPALITQVLSITFLEIIKTIPDIAIAFPSIVKMASMWWIYFAITFVGMTLLLIKFIFLSPRRQFVPPSISLNAIKKLVKTEHGKINWSSGEIGKVGMASGAAAGSLVCLGFGTIVGALIGAFAGLFGKDFNEIKNDAKNNILREVDLCFNETDNCIKTWIKSLRADLFIISTQCFKHNCKKIARASNTKLLRA